MTHKLSILWALVAVGCATEGPVDQPETSTDAGEVGIFFGLAPDDVNCVSFKLDNADGTSASFQFAMTLSNVRVIRNLTVGAYDLSAVAYQSPLPRPTRDDDCADVPLDAPWSTQGVVPVVVQRNRRSNIDLTLLRAGRLGITLRWFEAPEVVAQGQGFVGPMVANTLSFGTFVAWAVAAQDGPTGEVRALFDNPEFPGQPPFTLIPGLPNPAAMAIDSEFNSVYVSNLVTGTTDAEGNVISDGAIVNDVGTFIGGINPGDIGIAVANHTAYWVGMPPGARIGSPVPFNIDCFPCFQPLATDQVGANGLAAFGNRVFWGTADGALKGMAVTDSEPTTLASVAPRQAYGASADDQFAYFIDVAPGESISASKIDRVPVTGGPAVTLVDGIPGGAFPIVAARGFVYFLAPDGIKRVSRDGGPVEAVVSGAIGGFAVASDLAGHDVIYWSDVTHGGLIWRGRL
jgi:hypothetical protein